MNHHILIRPLLIVVITISCHDTFAQKSQRGLSAREVARRSSPSVVLLLTKDASGKPISLGSGFFVRPDVIVTNYHVVRHAARVYSKTIGTDSVSEVAGLVGASEDDDLALVKLKRVSLDGSSRVSAPTLPLANLSTVAVGDQVYVVGNPEGLEGTFSQGVVSALRGDKFIQITAPISAGSSGGPVLNNKAQVIGVASGMIGKGQNLNFAVPVAKVSQLVSRMSASIAPLPSEPEKPQAGSSATSLRETLNWLQSNLSKYGSFKTDTVGGSAKVRLILLPISFKGRTISWKQSTFYEYRSGAMEIIEFSSEVPLASLEDSSITTLPGSSDLGYLVRLVLPTSENKKVIHTQIIAKGSKHPTPSIDESNMDITQIYFENREMTDRITNAFRHAIELCRDQKEPF